MAEGDGQEVGWLEEFVGVVRELHGHVLDVSSGLAGEHSEKLYAACARPFQSAFGEPLYTSPFAVSAALFHGIICDHAFVDGNKRTGSIAAIWLLRALRPELAEPGELQVRMLGELAVVTASGGIDVHEAARWLERIFGPTAPT